MAEETKNKLKIVVCVLLVVFLVGGLVALTGSKITNQPIKVLTEKKSYTSNEELKVEIDNDTGTQICFSSCYPYFMQADQGNWQNYSYAGCDKENVVESCISAQDMKAFGITLGDSFIKSTLHRLAIPACIGCAVGDQFRVDKILYSNEFELK